MNSHRLTRTPQIYANASVSDVTRRPEAFAASQRGHAWARGA